MHFHCISKVCDIYLTFTIITLYGCVRFKFLTTVTLNMRKSKSNKYLLYHILFMFIGMTGF